MLSRGIWSAEIIMLKVRETLSPWKIAGKPVTISKSPRLCCPSGDRDSKYSMMKLSEQQGDTVHFISHPWSLWKRLAEQRAAAREPLSLRPRGAPLLLWSVEWQHLEIAGDWRDHTEFADGCGKNGKMLGVCVDLMGSPEGLRFTLYPVLWASGLRGYYCPARSRNNYLVWVSVGCLSVCTAHIQQTWDVCLMDGSRLAYYSHFRP